MMKAPYRIAPPMASIATPGPAPKVASTMASTHHEQASSNAPAVSDSVPSEVLARPRSLMMRASIGKAVSAMQAPMNSVALACEMPAANRPGHAQQQRRDQHGDENGRRDARQRHAHRAARLGLEVVQLQRGADQEHVQAHAQLRAGVQHVARLLGEDRRPAGRGRTAPAATGRGTRPRSSRRPPAAGRGSWRPAQPTTRQASRMQASCRKKWTLKSPGA